MEDRFLIPVCLLQSSILDSPFSRTRLGLAAALVAFQCETFRGSSRKHMGGATSERSAITDRRRPHKWNLDLG